MDRLPPVAFPRERCGPPAARADPARHPHHREPRRADQMGRARAGSRPRSEGHTSELQSLMRISYAVFCLKKKTIIYTTQHITVHNLSHKHNNVYTYTIYKSIMYRQTTHTRHPTST